MNERVVHVSGPVVGRSAGAIQKTNPVRTLPSTSPTGLALRADLQDFDDDLVHEHIAEKPVSDTPCNVLPVRLTSMAFGYPSHHRRRYREGKNDRRDQHARR